MKVAVVGVTGLVGQVFLKGLEERNFPVDVLIPVASPNSIGQIVTFRESELKVIGIEEALKHSPDLALFSAGSSVSLEFAPKFAEQGAVVIDNSSAWRMHENIKLIVPEVNCGILTGEDKLIANPNCSTIQLVVALNRLHQHYKIKRIVVSTYQSVTGTGKAAVDQLMNERNQKDAVRVYPYPIDMNALPHIDVFQENGYTKEELKMIKETQKIFNDPDIKVTATCVRLPVIGGHSESINVEFEKGFEIKEAITILKNSPGVSVEDSIDENIYPMPINAQGKDEVFVGRIRKDESQSNSLNLWVVSDNLRKGAAINAIQIAEYLNECKLIQ